MTTYAEFQAYYLRTIWREGDTVFETDLPKLIKEAEARINRDLRRHNITSSFVEENATEDSLELPGDFREMITVSIEDRAPAKFVPYVQFLQEERNKKVGYDCYTINNNRVYFTLKNSPDPVKVSLNYYAGVTPYEDDPETPFYDLYPDFYKAAVHIQAYSYLRDFDLSTEYNTQYGVLLDSMVRDSNYAVFPSGQLSGNLPHGVR